MMETFKVRVGLVALLALVLASAVSCANQAGREPGKVVDDARFLCGPALLTTVQGAEHTPDDATVVAEVRAALAADQRVDAAAISVASVNGKVVLTGAVKTEDERRRAASVARSVMGVVGVRNLLKVK